MKNTQKKLKAKHFRYLSEEYVKHPDRFLKEIVHQWGLNWSENFNLLINSSFYPPMRADMELDHGFIHTHLGQMIEAGFVILKKCNLEPLPKDDLFQYSCKKEFEMEIEENGIFPEKALRTFFGFKTLKEWMSVLDDLLMHRDYTVATMNQIQLELDYIPIRELLVKLPKVLQEIYDRGGLHYCLPAKKSCTD